MTRFSLRIFGCTYCHGWNNKCSSIRKISSNFSLFSHNLPTLRLTMYQTSSEIWFGERSFDKWTIALHFKFTFGMQVFLILISSSIHNHFISCLWWCPEAMAMYLHIQGFSTVCPKWPHDCERWILTRILIF